jgi:hypothetical protein
MTSDLEPGWKMTNQRTKVCFAAAVRCGREIAEGTVPTSSDSRYCSSPPQKIQTVFLSSRHHL